MSLHGTLHFRETGRIVTGTLKNTLGNSYHSSTILFHPSSLYWLCLSSSLSLNVFFYSHLKCANEVFTNIEYFVVGNPAMLFPHE